MQKRIADSLTGTTATLERTTTTAAECMTYYITMRSETQTIMKGKSA